MVPTPAPLHLAVALDGAGWHPAAWREPDAQPRQLFTAGYWTELAQQAERGLLDFLTIEDRLDLQSDDHFQADSRTDRVRGRLPAFRGARPAHVSVSADQDRARQILGVPADGDVAFLLGIGYPADRPLRPIAKPNRRPLGEVIHHGHW